MLAQQCKIDFGAAVADRVLLPRGTSDENGSSVEGPNDGASGMDVPPFYLGQCSYAQQDSDAAAAQATALHGELSSPTPEPASPTRIYSQHQPQVPATPARVAEGIRGRLAGLRLGRHTPAAEPEAGGSTPGLAPDAEGFVHIPGGQVPAALSALGCFARSNAGPVLSLPYMTQCAGDAGCRSRGRAWFPVGQ